MEKRNGLITFISALIPGVGYMYLGLIKKGVQTLALFLMVDYFLPLLGIGFLENIILIPFWCYTFFDTYNIAAKLNRGEQVNDTDYIFEKTNWLASNTTSVSGDRSFFIILAWALIVVGILAIINKLMGNNYYYRLIMSCINIYFFPTLLIVGGIFLLVRENKRTKR